MIKWFLLPLAAAPIAISCMSPGPEEAKVAGSPEPMPTSMVSQQTGMTQLYNENCAKCHGEKGEGGGGGTKSVNTREKFDQKWDKPFFEAIKNGVPDMGMEAYGTTMSDPQIWGLVVHMRELQGRALRAQFAGPDEKDGIYETKRAKYKIETVLDEELHTPWAVDWLPTGDMLVTNRPGTITVKRKNGDVLSVEGLPESRERGQGGLMEVSVHPNYQANGWIYLAISDPGGQGVMTKIVRGKLRFDADKAVWSGTQDIWKAPEASYTGAGVHFGCRIVFDGKGNIFFGVGERGQGQYAQDLSRTNGKIFRVKEDGTIPSDNPFVETKDALKAIWSYGHRNPQGLVIDKQGNLWDTEHGPRGGDELNLIKKGANYGWPLVNYSINYTDAPLSTPWATGDKKIEQPVDRWMPSIGACGLDVMRGKAFPDWEGDLFAGGLVGQSVDRFRVKDGKLVEREEIFWGHGRVREVATGPDGMLYMALNEPDKVVRLVPMR